MKISIKKFKVEMELKNSGIEFEVRDQKGNFKGNLILSKSKLTWCKGKTSKDNGKDISWDEFIHYMENK